MSSSASRASSSGSVSRAPAPKASSESPGSPRRCAGGRPADRARLLLTGWGPLLADVARQLRRGPRAVPLTLAACAGILVLQLLQHGRDTYAWVDRLGGVYAGLPWWLALLRTPLSLFLPDPSLPVWGLIVQVVVVFGIAETTVGAGRTLGVSLLATLAGTGFARYALWAGPNGLFGLPGHDLLVRDTGPSAAVVALGVYIAFRYRAWWTVGAIVLAMVVELISLTNLAGYEHLAGVAVVLVLCWAGAARRPGPARTAVNGPSA